MNPPPAGNYSTRLLLAPTILGLILINLSSCTAIQIHSSDVRTFYCDEGKVFRLSENAKQGQAILFLAGKRFDLKRLNEDSGRSYANSSVLVGLDAPGAYLNYKGIRVMENCSTEGNPEVHIIAVRNKLSEIGLPGSLASIEINRN